MTQILLFGDSIVYGAWDLEGGWAHRLRKLLDEIVIKSNYKEYYLVYNLGIDGDTSEGLLKRFEQEAKQRISPDEEIIFIFHIGDNDSLFNNKTKKHLVSPEDYEKNIREIISKAKRYSTKIIFIDSYPIDESKVDPVPWVENCSYTDKTVDYNTERMVLSVRENRTKCIIIIGFLYKTEYLSKFRDIGNKVCMETKCYFINLNKHLEANKWVKHLPDGVHADTEGYEKTFKIIKDYLIKNKILYTE